MGVPLAPICHSPLQVQYSARAAGAEQDFPPVWRGERWKLFEDVVGRPGWIGQAPSTGVVASVAGQPESLAFRLPCADVIVLEMLRTYNASGSVRALLSRPLNADAIERAVATMTMPTGGMEWRLETNWEKGVSFIEPATLHANGSAACPAAMPPYSARVGGKPPKLERLLVLTLHSACARPSLPFKFKVTSLLACALHPTTTWSPMMKSLYRSP